MLLILVHCLLSMRVPQEHCHLPLAILQTSQIMWRSMQDRNFAL